MIQDLYDRLADTDCRYCETGTLSVGSFKGAPAILCENCGTPAIRIW